MSKKSFDAAVVGGGPIGGFTAKLIAKAGFSVAVIEEHSVPGEPVQCAGLISPRCLDIADGAKYTVMNKLSGARIYPPSGNPLDIGGKEIHAVAIDRAAFDRNIMDGAADAGAAIFTGTRVKVVRTGRAHSSVMADTEITAKLVIGADGAKSCTRKALGLEEPAFMMHGINAEVKGLDIAQDRAIVFFGRELAPNFFAWMIPAGDVIRVGLCVRGTDRTPHEHFKRLFKLNPAACMLRGAKVQRIHSGLIPFGMMSRTYGDGGMVVGDAACQVKATSGGGIYPGLVCARHCAESAVSALGEGDVSAKALSRYHSAWTCEIGDELDKAMMMHRVLSGLDDRQLDDIFGMLANPEINDIINSVGDIDYPSRLGWMLLRKEPGFLKYAGKFLRHGLLEM